MSASEVTLSRFLRRTKTVKGCGFDARLIVFGDDRYTWWRISWIYPKWRTASRSSLLIRVNGSYNLVELLANSIHAAYFIETHCDEYSVAWEWRYPNSLAGNGSLWPQQCVSIKYAGCQWSTSGLPSRNRGFRSS